MATIFLNTIDRLIECLALQVANLPTYQAAVGASAADITAVTEALANLEYIRDYSDLIDANKKTVFQIKALIFNGDPDETVPAFPVFPAGGLPETPLAGELERANIRNRRFKLGPAYNEEIGTALGIESSGSGSIPIGPGGITPTLELHPAASGGMFACIVGNRGESDAWRIEILRTGGSTWQNVSTYTGKSADVTITLTNPAQPEQIQVRVQLRKNNENYGNVSTATTITVNP